MGLREELAVALFAAGALALVFTGYKSFSTRTEAGVATPAGSGDAGTRALSEPIGGATDAHAVQDAGSPHSSRSSSGAGLLFSPPEAAPNQEQVQGQPVVSGGGLSSSPNFAASYERWLDMSGALYGALEDLTIGDLRELDESFWEENHEWAYLLARTDGEPVRNYFQGIEDPRRALERAWEDPANRVLWEKHQQLYRQQHVGSQTGADLAMTQRQLAQLRDALWSGISPAHQFLHRLAQETR